MIDTRDCLIEIGTEELPPKALSQLARVFAEGIKAGLEQHKLAFCGLRSFATPRRLAVLLDGLQITQPEQTLERRGPSLAAAFKDGQPTKAAEGFARSCGVAVSDLRTVETDKGAWLAHVRTEPGKPAETLLPGIVETALQHLPIPKRMRWGDSDTEFVRPVHWLVLLLGDRVVPATILGVSSDRHSRGHRFHHNAPITLTEPAAYESLLQDQGWVIADFAKRRDRILQQATAIAGEVRGQAVIQDDLLDEVTALVEWPVALLGNFDRRYLEVPAEALMTTMQDNQKYFPVVDSSGRLLPHFITIANLESRDPDQVRSGNERVIRPRFADAEFFWRQDRKQTLASRIEALKSVIFEQKLGTLHDKSRRVASLAEALARQLHQEPELARQAASLAKCDLLTEMVQEFPELQGIMGRYYAGHDGEPAEVAQALEEQYRPRFAGDALPETLTGQVLALADRLDTLIGIFAIGKAPSGARDPFALRRAALGTLRILIEKDLDIDLEAALACGAATYAANIKAGHHVEAVFDFMLDRLRAYYSEQGFRGDEFEAVLECRPSRPLDFHRRIQAVAAFRKAPEAESLAAANKRIRNILKKVEGTLPFEINPDLLVEAAEQALAGRLAELASEAAPLLEQGYYENALLKLTALREPVDRFFDEVLVMADDDALRNNRIALLNELGSLFLRIADFSQLRDA